MTETPAKKFCFESNIFQTKYGTVKFTKGPNNSKRFTFINNKKSHEDAKDIILFDNSMRFLLQCLEEVVDVCSRSSSGDDNQPGPEESLYGKTINTYGNEICIRTVLEANRFQGTIYILLRRYFYAREPSDGGRELVDGDFKPCRGSFRFSDGEDWVEFRKFVERTICM